MRVKVNIETMTLKITDCDVFEGSILDMADGKVIELVMVDDTTPEQALQDALEGEKTFEETEPIIIEVPPVE
jgi:hypothetical protein